MLVHIIINTLRDQDLRHSAKLRLGSLECCVQAAAGLGLYQHLLGSWHRPSSA